jgi:hypothetical protein
LIASRCFRCTAAYRRISGAALGSIIAAIITHHMRSMAAACPTPQCAGVRRRDDIVPSMAMSSMPPPRIARV